MLWAPRLIDLLVWLKFWKKKSRSVGMNGKPLEVTKEFYDQDESKQKIPRAGGILIWVTALAITLTFWVVFKIENNETTQFLNFLDRRQTFIPLGTLFFAAIVGFIDDALATLESGGNYIAGGLKLTHRFGFVLILSSLIGLWFFYVPITKFNFGLVNIDFSKLLLFNGDIVNWSFLVVPLTIFILMALWGSSMIDGFDGLASGVFIPIYLSFAGLAFAKGFYDIATFLMVIVGAMCAYLWYNIPPAKFYMGDTGTMSLLLTIGVVAILIDEVFVLPLAGLMLVLTEGSVIIQVISKKFFKRKVFLAAPLHHHLEAKGWKKEQITMRYWLVSIMTSVLALAFGLLFR